MSMKEDAIVRYIQQHALPLNSGDDLEPLIEAIGDADYVLLGEASHGTSEFYTWRAEISKRLIERKGFSFIAVEGDWPSCYSVNRYVKGYEGAANNVREALRDFDRWPTWMWANREIADFAEWMKHWNGSRPVQGKVGFYGLDVYSLWESMEEITRYLESKGMHKELETARKAFECFEPFGREGQSYGISAAFLSDDCEKEVVELLRQLQDNREAFDGDPEAALSAELNALVAVNAERYYRAMVQNDQESWNIRDRHMVEALEKVMDFHGRPSTGTKAIIWEHNTHIGDARATDMANDGMVNVGQLLREANPDHRVFAVGFGTHRGSVIAGQSWGAPMKQMDVPPAVEDSWEDFMHRAGESDRMLIFNQDTNILNRVIGHRAIGVVYRPQNEWGNYVPTVLPKRYDAFIHIERSEALRPLVWEKALV